MGELFIERGNSLRTTGISNVFIDEYMPHAQEESVKVYLYIMRCFSDRTKEITVEAFADALNLDEESILSGFRYWQEQGLLTVCFDEDGQMSGIRINECLSKAKNEFKKPAKRRLKAEDISVKIGDEEFAGMLFAVSTYLGKPSLTPADTNSLIYIVEDLDFGEDLTLYLVEYCVASGHKSMRYIEKIALSWAELGISSVEDARKYVDENKENYVNVLKAFGISGRSAGVSERAYIDKWFDNFGFSTEIVVCACNKTLCSISSPSFQYADKILADWHEKGVKTLDDVNRVDKEFSRENSGQVRQMNFQATPKTNIVKSDKTKSSAQKKGTVKSFPQREYDFEELERRLLSKRG